MTTINENDIFIAGADESEDRMSEGIKKLFGGFCDPTSEKKESLFCDPSSMFNFSDDDVKDRSLATEEIQEAPKKISSKKRIGIASVLFVAVFAVAVGVTAFRTGQDMLPAEPVVPTKKGLFKRK